MQQVTEHKELKTEIGIADDHRAGAANLLNYLLADEHILYIKTRNYHWNVTGMDFHSLHTFFESQYTQLEAIIDGVAERVRQLGHYAVGNMRDFLKIARLNEDQEGGTGQDMIESLLEDHETIIRILREDAQTVNDEFRDVGTNDFLVGLMEQHEKMAWMLRAHISRR